MNTKTITINNNNYTFVNEFISNRSGFKHRSTLLKNDYQISSASIQYYNRTWEAYAYKSSMIKAVYKLLDDQKTYIKNNFMDQNNYKKLTPSRREALEKIIDDNGYIKTYNKLLEALR